MADPVVVAAAAIRGDPTWDWIGVEVSWDGSSEHMRRVFPRKERESERDSCFYKIIKLKYNF